MTRYMIALLPRRLRAVLAASSLLAANAWGLDTPCLPTVPPLRLAVAPTPLNDDLDYSSGKLSGDVQGNFELTDDVEVRFGERRISTQNFRYDQASNSFKVEGDVRYQDPTIRVEGDSGSYGDDGANFIGARFELLQQPGRGAAESVDLLPDGAIELNRVSYTTCPRGATDWQLRARRITLNTDTLRGVGRDTRIEFKGVPILYLPWISFPLSDARQTGLLFPTLGSSSRSGATLTVPWYWNIAPQQDMTVSPTLYTRRGIDLGVEYRLLRERSKGNLQLNYLPRDRVTNSHRSYQQLNTEWELPASWRVRLAGENVSDAHYFEDFALGPQASSTAFLARRAELSYRSDIWRLRGEVLQFQTLDTELSDVNRPYTQLPRLTAHGRWDTRGGLRATLDSEVAGFERNVGITGWRAQLTPGVAWPVVRPGYYFRPSVAWNLARYRLDHSAPGADDAPTRSLPIVNVDTALQLERSSGRNGARAITVEPRLLYVYIPYRDQSALPVFDSGLPDPNFVSLFRASRYVGGDRIGDANKITLGVTTRMFSSRTGQQFLSATFGQGYQLKTPRVSLPNESLDTRRRSNLIANIDLRAYRDVSLRADVAWNPQLSSTDKTQLALQYRPAGNRVINLGYRFDRSTSVEQADASAAWPVSKRWDLYARSVYSLRDRKNLENFAGLRFRGDCWGLRAVVRRSISSRTGAHDTGVYVQLELTGLSSVGTGADTFLQDSIQGYSAVTSSR